MLAERILQGATDLRLPSEILRGALVLVDLGWCQKALAAGPDHCAESPFSLSAVQWSVLGAIQRAAGGDVGRTRKAVKVLLLCLNLDHRKNLESQLKDWNDASGRTRNEVIKQLRDAATAVEEFEIFAKEMW